MAIIAWVIWILIFFGGGWAFYPRTPGTPGPVGAWIGLMVLLGLMIWRIWGVPQ